TLMRVVLLRSRGDGGRCVRVLRDALHDRSSPTRKQKEAYAPKPALDLPLLAKRVQLHPLLQALGIDPPGAGVVTNDAELAVIQLAIGPRHLEHLLEDAFAIEQRGWRVDLVWAPDADVVGGQPRNSALVRGANEDGLIVGVGFTVGGGDRREREE